MRSLTRFVLIAACLVPPVTLVFAQGIVTGAIAGRVTDPSGAPAPDVTITITNTATGVDYTGKSSADGFYQVRYLPIGVYSVAASQAGFQRVVRPNVLLDAASSPTVNFQLTIGAVSQSVTVTGGGILVESQTADRGNVVDPIFRPPSLSARQGAVTLGSPRAVLGPKRRGSARGIGRTAPSELQAETFSLASIG